MNNWPIWSEILYTSIIKLRRAGFFLKWFIANKIRTACSRTNNKVPLHLTNLNKYLYNSKSEIEVNINDSSKKLWLSVSQLQQNLLRWFCCLYFPRTTISWRSRVHKTRNRNKDLAFIDYRIALHSIPHFCFIKFLQLHSCRKILLNLATLYKMNFLEGDI
jgi:hypothetical protein